MKHLGYLFTILLCTAGCSRKNPETPASPPAPEVKKIESGIAVPGKPGFVQSPYAPDKGYVDVRGFPKGTEVKDPYSGRIFIVPEGMDQAPVPTPKTN